jgi:hypothetical protein
MQYAVSYETTCRSNLENFPEELHTHDHEEAGTLILLHAINISSRNPFAELHIYSPDTNVFLLTVSKYPDLCTNTVFRTGQGEKLEIFLSGISLSIYFYHKVPVYTFLQRLEITVIFYLESATNQSVTNTSKPWLDFTYSPAVIRSGVFKGNLN